MHGLNAKCFNKFSHVSKCFHGFDQRAPEVRFENYTWYWLTLLNIINKVKRKLISSISSVTSINASMSSTQELLKCVLLFHFFTFDHDLHCYHFWGPHSYGVGASCTSQLAMWLAIWDECSLLIGCDKSCLCDISLILWRHSTLSTSSNVSTRLVMSVNASIQDFDTGLRSGLRSWPYFDQL